MEYPGYGFYSKEIIGGQETKKKMKCSTKKIKE
jgi:hypothetical protein